MHHNNKFLPLAFLSSLKATVFFAVLQMYILRRVFAFWSIEEVLQNKDSIKDKIKVWSLLFQWHVPFHFRNKTDHICIILWCMIDHRTIGTFRNCDTMQYKKARIQYTYKLKLNAPSINPIPLQKDVQIEANDESIGILKIKANREKST